MFWGKLNVAQRATPLVKVLNPKRHGRLWRRYPQRVRLRLGALGGLVLRAEAHHARHDGAVAADVSESAATRTLLGGGPAVQVHIFMYFHIAC